jgi:hypothetical protein
MEGTKFYGTAIESIFSGDRVCVLVESGTGAMIVRRARPKDFVPSQTEGEMQESVMEMEDGTLLPLRRLRD